MAAVSSPRFARSALSIYRIGDKVFATLSILPIIREVRPPIAGAVAPQFYGHLQLKSLKESDGLKIRGLYGG
jgi:hypothetical protein